MLNIFKNDIKPVYRIVSKNVISNSNITDKHLHPQNKEWVNNIYYYNKNNVKHLPALDNTTNKLIKSYFNFFNKEKEEKTNVKRSRVRFLNKTVNRIFVSKAELRHTNSNIIVTVYVYNRQLKYYTNKLVNIGINECYNIYGKNYNSILENRKSSSKIFNKDYLENQFMFKNFLIATKNKSLVMLNKVLSQKPVIINSLSWNSAIFKHYEKHFLNNFINKLLTKQKLLIYYKHLIQINKFKFGDFYLLKLNKIIEGLYNKKVYFNLINLKRSYLNTDILLQIMNLKLKNRKSSLLRILRKVLKSIKLNSSKKLFDISYLDKNMEYNSNILQLSNLLSNINTVYAKNKKDLLNKSLKSIFTVEKKYMYIEKKIISLIKYKTVSGIRLEAKGRLTKRATAERSILKARYKGNLKNIDSSYRGFSSVMIRGQLRSNIQYSKLKSKTRNGSFGLKGWLSSR